MEFRACILLFQLGFASTAVHCDTAPIARKPLGRTPWAFFVTRPAASVLHIYACELKSARFGTA